MANPLGRLVHGFRNHPLYNIWNGMIQRTTNPKNPKYHLYGGAGRGVCEDWRNVEKFVTYVETTLGERPSKRHSIDRIDNTKGYEPGNIRWATFEEQKANSVAMSEETKHKISAALSLAWKEGRH